MSDGMSNLRLCKPADQRAEVWHITDETGTIVAIVYHEAIARQMAQAPQMAAALAGLRDFVNLICNRIDMTVSYQEYTKAGVLIKQAEAALDAAGVEHA